MNHCELSFKIWFNILCVCMYMCMCTHQLAHWGPFFLLLRSVQNKKRAERGRKEKQRDTWDI